MKHISMLLLPAEDICEQLIMINSSKTGQASCFLDFEDFPPFILENLEKISKKLENLDFLPTNDEE